jgi:hypothetical protein
LQRGQERESDCEDRGYDARIERAVIGDGIGSGQSVGGDPPA